MRVGEGRRRGRKEEGMRVGDDTRRSLGRLWRGRGREATSIHTKTDTTGQDGSNFIEKRRKHEVWLRMRTLPSHHHTHGHQPTKRPTNRRTHACTRTRIKSRYRQLSPSKILWSLNKGIGKGYPITLLSSFARAAKD